MHKTDSSDIINIIHTGGNSVNSLDKYRKIQKFFRIVVISILLMSFLFEKGTAGREMLNNAVKIILPTYLVLQFIYLYKIRDEL